MNDPTGQAEAITTDDVRAGLSEVRAVAKSISEWMKEGEELYNAAFKDYQNLEKEIQELEEKLVAKQGEVNQIAQIIGKPTVENNRRLTAQLVAETGPNSVPNSPTTIARALAGKHLGR